MICFRWKSAVKYKATICCHWTICLSVPRRAAAASELFIFVGFTLFCSLLSICALIHIETSHMALRPPEPLILFWATTPNVCFMFQNERTERTRHFQMNCFSVVVPALLFVFCPQRWSVYYLRLRYYYLSHMPVCILILVLAGVTPPPCSRHTPCRHAISTCLPNHVRLRTFQPYPPGCLKTLVLLISMLDAKHHACLLFYARYYEYCLH